jgi:putative Ca2+/H+ antiporter (TMEM165/GDT1 family)
MLEISVFFGMASFLLFAVAMGINDQQSKNDHASGKKDDNEWLIPPHIAHKSGEIGIHCRSIYTAPRERQNDG